MARDEAARWAAPVRVSCALSCGCTQPKSAPVSNIDAAVHPGEAIICPRHEEFAVVVRVTTYLADTTAASLAALLRAGGVDADTAEQVAAEQAPSHPPTRTTPGRSDPGTAPTEGEAP